MYLSITYMNFFMTVGNGREAKGQPSPQINSNPMAFLGEKLFHKAHEMTVPRIIFPYFSAFCQYILEVQKLKMNHNTK